MSRLSNLMGFLARAIITGLALAFVIVYLWPDAMKRFGKEPETTEIATAMPASYADAVNNAAPAVVSVYTTAVTPKFGPTPSADGSGLRLYSLVRQRNEGSGVILSQDGYILTNQHVVRQAVSISIGLWDGRIIPARIIGSDLSTDLAVLKVEVNGLPVAPIAENPAVRVGDVVLAIGNSLGLSHTVTMGIVSAIGRNDLGGLLYQDFIQTDAAINRGNSGGALVNTNGELVGINTRTSAMKDAQNIGFTIPIGLARDVMDQIIEYGQVRRGWLGASFGDLNPTLQPDGTAIRVGIGVHDVQRGGPAWEAGIRSGDFILTLDGELVSDASQFLLAISQRVPGSKVELEVQRGTEMFQTYATLIQQPPVQPPTRRPAASENRS
jgi:serine peptidase DegS